MKFRALNFDYHAEAVYRVSRAEFARTSNKPREVIVLCDATVHATKQTDNENEDNTVLSTCNNEKQEESRELTFSNSSNGDIENDTVANKRLDVAAKKVQQGKKVRIIDQIVYMYMMIPKKLLKYIQHSSYSISFSSQADIYFHQDGDIDVLNQSFEKRSSCNDSSTGMKSLNDHSDTISFTNDSVVPRRSIPQRPRHRQQLSVAQVRKLWNSIRHNAHVRRITCEPWSESLRLASRPRQPLPLPSLLWSANNHLLDLSRQEEFEHLVFAPTFAAIHEDSLPTTHSGKTSLVSGNFPSTFRFQMQQCRQQLQRERSLLAVVPSSRRTIQEKSINASASLGMDPNKLLRFAAQLAMVAVQQQQQQAVQARPDEFEILLDESTIFSEKKEDPALSSQKAKFLKKYTADIESKICEEDEAPKPSPPKRPRILDRKVTFSPTQYDGADDLDKEFSFPTSSFDNWSGHTDRESGIASKDFLPGGVFKGIFPPRDSTTATSIIAEGEKIGAASMGGSPFDEDAATICLKNPKCDPENVDENSETARKRRREEKRLRKQQKKARKERKKAKKRKKHDQSDSGADDSSQQNLGEEKETVVSPFASLNKPRVEKENSANPFSDVAASARCSDVDSVLREAKNSFKKAKAKTVNSAKTANETGSSRLPRGTMSSSDLAARSNKTPLKLFAQSFKQQKRHVSSRQTSQVLPMGTTASTLHGNNSHSSSFPPAAGMSGNKHQSQYLLGNHAKAAEHPSHSHYGARQGSLPNHTARYPEQTSVLGYPLQQRQHSQHHQQDASAAFTGQHQLGSRQHSDLPAQTQIAEHVTQQQYSSGQPYSQIGHQHKISAPAPAPPVHMKKPIDDPSLPPVQLLCSENFLETWGDMIAQLSSGKWANPKLSRSDPNDDCLQRRKIQLHDSNLVDSKSVDIELPKRGAIITYTTSALQEVDPAKEIVVNLARLAAAGVYEDVYVCLCYDIWPTGQILRHIAQLENAVIQQNGVPQTRFFFKPASEESLPSIFAEIILSRQRFFTGVHLESTNEFLEDEQTREWAWFLAKLLPIISANGAIQCMYLVKAISPGQSPIGTLFRSDVVRQKVQMNVTSVPSRAPEIHPYAMQQLEHIISVPFHLAGA